MTTILFGGPFVVLGTILGVNALASPPPAPAPPPSLPSRRTDAETLRLARTVRGLV